MPKPLLITFSRRGLNHVRPNVYCAFCYHDLISRSNAGIYINQPRQIEAFSVYSILLLIDDVNPDANKLRQLKQARSQSNFNITKNLELQSKPLKNRWHARNKIFDYKTAINHFFNAHLHTAAPRTQIGHACANTIYLYLGPLSSLELSQAT